MEFSSLISWCKLDEFILFFSSPRKKEERNPTHIAAHLQAHTSRRSNQRLAKELQFCPRTHSNLLNLSCFMR
jgi:hypothetical protein